MELNSIEVAALETAVKDAIETQIYELQDLQLALVGGGIGTVELG
jgi:hypothetical protein